MNSEELELSLRTEFESYLKEVLAGIRRDVSDFQKNFEAEFEKHKSQLDDAFRGLGERFETNFEFDPAFRSSVEEHLRLARDEGATLTAAAFGEAEKLAKEAAAPAANFDQLRDAISDISSKTSQADILRSLTEHASNFAPRGVFFIVRNEHLIGWKAFGDEAGVTDDEVREIKFSIASDTLLSAAVESLATEDNSGKVYEDDGLFLEPLGYGTPDRMYAIPLVARGRGVAVLYADYGTEGIVLNPEALETLVKVAGMTVELMAASHSATAVQTVQSQAAKTAEDQAPETEPAAHEETVSEAETTGSFEEFQAEHPQFETVETVEAVSEPAADPGFGFETIKIDQQDEAAGFEHETQTVESPQFVDTAASDNLAVEETPQEAETGAEPETFEAHETGFEFQTSAEPEAHVETPSYVGHEAGYDFRPSAEPEATVEQESYVENETGYDFQPSAEPEASVEEEQYVEHETGYDLQTAAEPEASVEEEQYVEHETRHDLQTAAEPETSVEHESEETHETSFEHEAHAEQEAADVPSYETQAEPETAVDAKEEYSYFEPVEESVVEETPSAESETTAEDSFTRADDRDNVGTFPVPEYSPRPDHLNGIRNGMVGVQTAEPAVDIAAVQTTPRIRFGERPVDLPIEVPEDERRLHNDARRFARLLVSEIKLYNEQKVAEGRQTGDLYERLREAIDRSRDMYDKRVQPPVASKFDYFHYELVNSLAEGEASKLGEGYPGAYLR